MSAKSILIVEDEAIIALGLADKLEQMGYAVAGTADTGEDALRLAREKRPDLILMDICIKGPVDGIDTAATIRRELYVPIVFLTSYSDDETVRRAALTAPYGYLTKPYKVKELRAVIEVALQKSALELQLRESERWFASALRCASDGIVVTDNDGAIRLLNPAAEKLTGWTLEEARGRRLEEVVRYSDEDTQADPAARARQEKRVVGIVRARPLCRRDGGQVLVDESAAPLQDDDGRQLGVVVMLRDATARTLQEERLRRSQEPLRSAFQGAGLALVSLSGRFIQVNEAFARMLGYPASELLSGSNENLTCPDDIAAERAQQFELVTDMTPVVQFEKRYRHHDGQRLLWTLVSATLLSEQGEPVCYRYQVYDISHRKAVESERERLARQAGTP